MGIRLLIFLEKKKKKNKELIYLRKKYKSSYKSIFFSNFIEIPKKLVNQKIDYFINFATFYKNSHKHNEIRNFVNANVLFPTIVLDLIFSKVKTVINFGTMMQHKDGKSYSPKNFYASTKSAFEMISNFYILRNKKMKFYNLKFYESYARSDTRKKLIPQLLINYKKNILTKIVSKKLELNIIHIKDIINAINIVLNNNLKNGTYCLKQKKNINIYNLIRNINKKLKKKIKVKYLNSDTNKPNKSNLKILPKWTTKYNIQKEIEEAFYNENN